MLMRKNKLAAIICFLFGCIWCVAAVAVPQPATPKINSDGSISAWNPLVLSTPDLSEGDYRYEDSVKLLVADIMKLDADLSGGIKGEMLGDADDNGYIKLEVFTIDNDHNKYLIYEVRLTETSDDYSTGDPFALKRVSDSDRVWHLRSDNIKQLLQFSNAYHYSGEERSRRGWALGVALGAFVGGGLAALVGAVLFPATGGASLSLTALGIGLIGAGIGATSGGIMQYTETTDFNSRTPSYKDSTGFDRIIQFDETTDERYKTFPHLQPVIIKLTINKAVFRGMKIPGLGEIKPSFFATRLTMKVNGNEVWEYPYVGENALNGYADTSEVNVYLEDVEHDFKIGDEITFEVDPAFFAYPHIRGVPDVWIARFAGDLMYYSTPSVVPGGYKPFLGYDTRVHNLMLRRYPDNFEKRYSNVVWGDGHHQTRTWTWTLARRMELGKRKYSHIHDWPKSQTLTNPITLLDGTLSHKQRRNQKEGLNMQYLTYWQDWETSDFRKYNGPKYMMGFDDDELAIFGTKYPNPQDDPHTLPDDIHVLKLERLPWKEMPEGPQIYSEKTGYPESGFVLNEMVHAYLKAQGSFGHPGDTTYNGYEIQDNGTSQTHPNGDGTGNNAAPGLITIDLLRKRFNIYIDVTAPLTEDHGFYGSIEGTKWPSYGEQNVPYTLKGLQGLSDEELNKYSLEYEYEDKLGLLQQQTHYLKDESPATKNSVRTTGNWTAHFDIHLPSYASITAYYQRDTDYSPRMMFAGKELKPIFLLFTGVQKTKGRSDLENNIDLLEGRGTGSKIWLEDFRNKQYDDYTVSRRFGDSVRHTKKYSKEYVFHVNDRVTFVTFDGDPHTFASNDNEWYLGSRYMANRVTDEYLDGSYAGGVEDAYLKYYIKDLDVQDAPYQFQMTGRTGKEFTRIWDNPGLYEMKVSYRGESSLFYKIKVVDYGHDTVRDAPILGQVVDRELKRWEKAVLKLPPGTNLRVAEVVDIYSRYAYVDGPRATKPKENRWAAQRDFDSRFYWFTGSGNNLASYSMYDSIPSVKAFVDSYDYKTWFWKDWAHHYSSNWLSPAASDGGQGLPPGLNANDVHRIRDEKHDLDPFNDYMGKNLFTPTPPANWQYTIPLVSVTKNQGMRLRTNPSCIYDLYKVFDPVNGAFSGNPKLPPTAESIQAPNISDRDKDAQELYYKLRNEQMVLYSPSSFSSGEFSVYNHPSSDQEKSSSATFMTFIARGNHATSP